MRPDVKVSPVLHTSPVTDMGVELTGIVAAIHAVVPDCILIIDGIRYAAHGCIDVDVCGIDGYVISPYRVFPATAMGAHGFVAG